MAESPLVKNVHHAQDVRPVRHGEEVLRSALNMIAATGLFPPDVTQRIVLSEQLPSPVARDREKEVQADVQLMNERILAPQELSTRQGLDFVEQQELFTQAEADGWESRSFPGDDRLAEAAAKSTFKGERR